MSEDSKKSFSFGFAKKSSVKKLQDSKLRDDSTKDKNDETDFVLELNKSGIQGTKKVEVKQELVIPCIGNTYKAGIKTQKIEKPEKPEKPFEELTEEEKAAKELLEDAKNFDLIEEENKNANLVVEIQANEKALFEADVESRPEVSSQEDYEKIPVEGFGLGMLRGMGFNPSEGIGGFRKAKVDCIDPVIRPKGLGLGATRTNTQSKNGKNKDGKEEKLVLKKGAFVKIESGPHKSQYGEIEGLDDETARVIVKVHGQIVSISENIVTLVTKEEFKKFKNVINKEMYDKYSEKQKEREKEWEKRRIFEEEPQIKKKKKSTSTWVRPRLKVRIVDKKSKYYKEKVIVNDVLSFDQIEVLTDSGRILDNIDPYDVETVIPKSEYSLIMIVKKSSEHVGKVAEMLRKDTRKESATIRILPDKEIVLNMNYDDICELADDRDLF